MNFKLRTHAKDRLYNHPHFFLLSKGNNAGRPMTAPCPNCFVLILDNEPEKLRAYWICYCLWQSRRFSRLLIGSVIPFLRIKETSNLLAETNRRCGNGLAFDNYAHELEKIRSLEMQLSGQLAKVRTLKVKLAAACLAGH